VNETRGEWSQAPHFSQGTRDRRSILAAPPAEHEIGADRSPHRSPRHWVCRPLTSCILLTFAGPADLHHILRMRKWLCKS